MQIKSLAIIALSSAAVASASYAPKYDVESVDADVIICDSTDVTYESVEAEKPSTSEAEDEEAPYSKPTSYESVVEESYAEVATVISSEEAPTPCPTLPNGEPVVSEDNNHAHHPEHSEKSPTPAPTVSYNEADAAEVADNVEGVEYATGSASSTFAIGLLSMALPAAVYFF